MKTRALKKNFLLTSSKMMMSQKYKFWGI